MITYNLTIGSFNLIQEGKDFMKETTWHDIDSDGIEELSDREVLIGIKEHYSGGIIQFIRDLK